MKILSGLFSGQVLQRNARQVACARITGSCNTTTRAMVEVSVLHAGTVLPGARGGGEAVNGAWQAWIEDLPVGGPYEVRFRLPDEPELRVTDVRVGDVWFLGGQSNMHGAGDVADALPPHPEVQAFYNEDEWRIAEEPLTLFWGAVDPVHTDGNPPMHDPVEIRAARRNTRVGVGPGLAFGRDMFAATGVPQGLVCCAHGGTSMDQWSPALREKGGWSLYGALLRRFKKLGQPVAGVLWWQGCSDAGEPEPYTRKMQELVAAVRQDFAQPDLPWLMVQIGRIFPNDGSNRNPGWLSIQDQQRRLPESIHRLSVVPAVDLEMEDSVHISANGQKLAAKRLARIARFQLGEAGVRDAIRLADIQALPPAAPGAHSTIIEGRFENVAGELGAVGAPTGFRLVSPEGESRHCIHTVRCEGATVRLYFKHLAQPLQGWRLAYGFECDATCNITDSEGMALPVFAPQPIRIPNPNEALQ
jgi:hypothetical protein